MAGILDFYGYDSGANDIVSQKQQQANIDNTQDKKIKELEEGGETPKQSLIQTTYSELKSLRDNSQLIPGCWYRIIDYITTVNEAVITNARSAGHPFDIVVMALTADTLSEDALAVQHDGDTYFQNSRLGAWGLKYTLDNVNWSKQAGTYVYDEDNEYIFFVLGDITLQGHKYKLLQGFGMYVEDWSNYALMDSIEEGGSIYCYRGVPEEFDPEYIDEVGTASSVETISEGGNGTITWMKDEFGNECPYDFKTIQFKRYMTTDSASERKGFNDKYMLADSNDPAAGLSADETDFIWAYTFSSDNSGGEQEDYSLTSEHKVHDNVFKPYRGGLPNNVMFGSSNYGNTFGYDCYNNSCGAYCQNNYWGNSCYNNSCGDICFGNYWGNSCINNSCGNGFSSNFYGNDCSLNYCGTSCGTNSWGNSCHNNFCGDVCYHNSYGNNCYNNSCGNTCQSNSWGNDCSNNSWGSNVTYTTLFDGVAYTKIISNNNIRYAQVLNGVAGTSLSWLTLPFEVNKTYTQVATLNSNGQLKIYVPGNLVQ